MCSISVAALMPTLMSITSATRRYRRLVRRRLVSAMSILCTASEVASNIFAVGLSSKAPLAEMFESAAARLSAVSPVTVLKVVRVSIKKASWTAGSSVVVVVDPVIDVVEVVVVPVEFSSNVGSDVGASVGDDVGTIVVGWKDGTCVGARICEMSTSVLSLSAELLVSLLVLLSAATEGASCVPKTKRKQSEDNTIRQSAT